MARWLSERVKPQGKRKPSQVIQPPPNRALHLPTRLQPHPQPRFTVNSNLNPRYESELEDEERNLKLSEFQSVVANQQEQESLVVDVIIKASFEIQKRNNVNLGVRRG